MSIPPDFMTVRGKPGSIEKLDDYTVRFSFPFPNGTFPAKLTQYASRPLTDSPAHYLRLYHPVIGDQALIKEHMQRRRLPNEMAVYRDVKGILNPLHPRLWPWVYRPQN